MIKRFTSIRIDHPTNLEIPRFFKKGCGRWVMSTFIVSKFPESLCIKFGLSWFGRPKCGIKYMIFSHLRPILYIYINQKIHSNINLQCRKLFIGLYYDFLNLRIARMSSLSIFIIISFVTSNLLSFGLSVS